MSNATISLECQHGRKKWARCEHCEVEDAQREEQLLSCPFCGSKAEIVQASNDPRCWIVRCTDEADDASMACPVGPEIQDDNRAMAIVHWNHREPHVDARIAALEARCRDLSAALERAEAHANRCLEMYAGRDSVQCACQWTLDGDKVTEICGAHQEYFDGALSDEVWRKRCAELEADTARLMFVTHNYNRINFWGMNDDQVRAAIDEQIAIDSAVQKEQVK